MSSPRPTDRTPGTTTEGTPGTPTLGRLATGSLVVALLATVVAFVLTQVLLSFSEQVTLGVVLSLVVTGAVLAAGSYVLGARVGAPTSRHLAAGSLGGVLLALGALVSGTVVWVAVPVALVYLGLTAVGLRAGTAAGR